MATRKAPTGPKHDRCIGHVEHPYPAKGVLCFGAVIGEAGMVEFADHLATVRAEHSAADSAEREAMHLAARPGAIRPAAKRSSKRRTNLIAGAYVAPEHVIGQSFSGRATVSTTAADAAALADLVARYRAMRGLPAVDAPAIVAPVRKARPVKVAPVVAEPIAETPASVVTPEPDTYAAAVAIAADRPDPCTECGHAAHGATCSTCDDAAQVGTYSPCADVAPVVATIAPSHPYRFDDTIRHPGESRIACAACHAQDPAPVSAPADRPTCPRCGQSFRVKGSGLSWHLVNRPDCARVAVAS